MGPKSAGEAKLVAPTNTSLGSVSMALQLVAPSTASSSPTSASQASRSKRFFCRASCARLEDTGWSARILLFP